MSPPVWLIVSTWPSSSKVTSPLDSERTMSRLSANRSAATWRCDARDASVCCSSPTNSADSTPTAISAPTERASATASSRVDWVHGSTWGMVGSGRSWVHAATPTAIARAIEIAATIHASRRVVTAPAPTTVSA